MRRGATCPIGAAAHVPADAAASTLAGAAAPVRLAAAHGLMFVNGICVCRSEK